MMLNCFCYCSADVDAMNRRIDCFVCVAGPSEREREREGHTWMFRLISLEPKLILTQHISSRPDPVTHSGSSTSLLHQTDLWHLMPTLTFLVPEEEGLLCWIWPLEGGVIIIIHSAGHVSRAALDHRHILGDGELSLATCRETDKERERDRYINKPVLHREGDGGGQSTQVLPGQLVRITQQGHHEGSLINTIII